MVIAKFVAVEDMGIVECWELAATKNVVVVEMELCDGITEKIEVRAHRNTRGGCG